jgi:hypothetical protein
MVRIVSKRTTPATFIVSTEGLPAGVRQSGFAGPVTVDPLAELVSPLVLLIERRDYRGPFKFTVKLSSPSDRFALVREVEFMGPDARLLEEEDHEKGIRR